MKAFVLGFGNGYEADVPELLQNPVYRRSSAQMALAVCAATRAFENAGIDPKSHPDTAVVLGSSHGELEVTVDFLETLAKKKIARPFLFQNSLHNSTAGFLALQFGFHGPVLTTSNLWQTGEDALDIAAGLIESQRARKVLVIGVDTLCKKLEQPMRSLYPQDWPLGTGAGALLLTARENARYELQTQTATAPATKMHPRFDSDLIFHAVEALKNSVPGEVILNKPSGKSTQFRWTQLS